MSGPVPPIVGFQECEGGEHRAKIDQPWMQSVGVCILQERQFLGHECITKNKKTMLQFAGTAISVSVYVFSLRKIQFPFAIRT